MLNIEFSSFTFKGHRDYNQDRILAKKIGESTFVFAVADGMGGANGGEQASSLVVSHLEEYIGKEKKDNLIKETLKELLYDAIMGAQKLILNNTIEDKTLTGMGTTLSCVLMHENNYVWASIGDSRIYKMNSNTIDQITIDHTYIQEFLNNKSGKLPQSIVNNYSHILTKCIDGKMQEPDIFPSNEPASELQDGETFLLCSDGLITDKINTNSNLLKNVVYGTAELDKAVKNLVGYAYQMGSKDNISLVIVRVGKIKISEENIKEYDFPDDDNDN